MGKFEHANMSVVRRSIQSYLQEQAKDILLSLWREQTKRQYESIIRNLIKVRQIET